MENRNGNEIEMHKKNLICICAALLFSFVFPLSFFAAGCGNGTKEGVRNDKNLPVIVIGSDNYPPYNYEDANGNPTGIDVDLATEAFYRIGYRAVFTLIDWEEKKELVESGKIDCIWGSFSIDGREDLYKWSSPYMYSRQIVAVRKSSDIYTLSDLKGKKIAVQSTTKPEEIFLSRSDPRIPEIAEIFSLQDIELLYPFLSKGYADAIAAHEVSVLQGMADYNLTDFRILEEPLLSVGLGVAFAKTDARGLEKKLSEKLKEMHDDGTMEKIVGNYLENPGKYLEADGYAK